MPNARTIEGTQNPNHYCRTPFLAPDRRERRPGTHLAAERSGLPFPARSQPANDFAS